MHDEWQAGDRRRLNEGSMVLLYPDSDRRGAAPQTTRDHGVLSAIDE